MAISENLPKFRQPPVEEVVVGIQFTASKFLPIHYGLFYEQVKSKFPTVEVRPPLPPFFDFQKPTAVPPIMDVNIFGLPARVLFVAGDGCSLVQLQNDRLYFNWRRGPNNAEYVHYKNVSAGFAEVYQTFELFASDQGFGPIMPTSCEVVYVNQFTDANSGVPTSSPEKLFGVWKGQNNDEWDGRMEDLAFNARYRLFNDNGSECGRLTAAMSTVPTAEMGVSQMRLELVARGQPMGNGYNGIAAFHDIGHSGIVRCFAAITTETMHLKWGRYV